MDEMDLGPSELLHQRVNLELDLKGDRVSLHAGLAAAGERPADGGRSSKRVAALEAGDRPGDTGGDGTAAGEEEVDSCRKLS